MPPCEAVQNDPWLVEMQKEMSEPDRYVYLSRTYWERFLNRYIFNSPSWRVTYRVPLLVDGEKDDVVDHLVCHYMGANTTTVLLCHECHKNANTPKNLAAMEKRAWSACRTYCANTGQHLVYALTTHGSRARLWKYDAANPENPSKDCAQLEPLWGARVPARYEDYVDLQGESGAKIARALETIKLNPPFRIV